MNRLFYIAAYSHRLNDWQRMALTARTPEKARQEAQQSLPPDWSVERVIDICATPDNLHTDL